MKQESHGGLGRQEKFHSFKTIYGVHTIFQPLLCLLEKQESSKAPGPRSSLSVEGDGEAPVLGHKQMCLLERRRSKMCLVFSQNAYRENNTQLISHLIICHL